VVPVVTVDRDQTRREAEWFDKGVESVWDEVVCSVCGQNHDRDESAACDGCEAITFQEWVERTETRLAKAQAELERADEDHFEHLKAVEIERTRADAAEARLAKVPALVKFVRGLSISHSDVRIRDAARDALAVWEQE
jgi:hypothetical protein